MEYQPELGQAAFGNPYGSFATPEAAKGIFLHILNEIERVFWNKNQREWDGYEDPSIPGICFRSYYWGDNEEKAALPNLVLESEPLEIRWYKHPHRGLSSNLEYTPQQWFDWCEKCIAVIYAADGLPNE